MQPDPPAEQVNRLRGRAIWVLLYAVAMALVESAVVVYLRALSPVPGPLEALHTILPVRILAIEVVREAATLVMLVAVAALAGRGAWQRFLFFALAFGIWDIFYYVWLKVFIGWPVSLLTWDVLFLIPVPWVAPVLAPVLVSLGLVVGSLWLLRIESHTADGRFQVPWFAWVLACVGAGLILLAFTVDAHFALTSSAPAGFRWGLFGSGFALAVLGLIAGGRATGRASGT